MLRIAYAFSIITGTIIGAGLFALPYLTLKTSPIIMGIYFIVLGIIVTLVHYFFAEIALKTPDFIRLPGFVKYHLGKKIYKIALMSGILGLLGANLVFLIIGGSFLEVIFSPILGFGETFYTIIYFTLGSALIFLGVKAIGKVQLYGIVLLLISLIVLLIKTKDYIDFSGLSFYQDSSYLFMPYGVVLFSLWGLSLIPEAEEILGSKKYLLNKIIFASIFFSILVYVFFIFIVLGIMGDQTTPNFLVGLQDFLGRDITILIMFLAIITTFTSFISIGLTAKKILWYDMGIDKTTASTMTCFIPLLLFFLGFNNFIWVISIVGGIMLAIDGILVSIIYGKIGPPRMKFLVYPVILALVLGSIYEVANFII